MTMRILGLIMFATTAVVCQTAVPLGIPATLRDHLKQERFELVTSIRGLPLGVRDGLQSLFGGSLDIAESGAEFQRTDTPSTSTLPRRRLAAAGCSVDHCVVYYERGAGAPAWLVAIFHWTPDGTRFEWGGAARSDLATIDDVKNAVLTGAVKGPVKAW